MALVLREGDEGLHLFGAGGYDLAIPNTAQLTRACEPPSPSQCPTSCHETGSGVQSKDFAAARANDGSVWVGWVTTQFDYVEAQVEHCDERDGTGCACVWEEPESDASTYTFHLARVVDDELEEFVNFKVPELALTLTETARRIDMRAYGDRLAIGMAVAKPTQVRLLEIDIGGV